MDEDWFFFNAEVRRGLRRGTQRGLVGLGGDFIGFGNKGEWCCF